MGTLEKANYVCRLLTECPKFEGIRTSLHLLKLFEHCFKEENSKKIIFHKKNLNLEDMSRWLREMLL